MVPLSPFKNTAGQRFTKALFLEMSYKEPDNCIYTLKDYDYRDYKSLYLLYIEEEDPTEYEFANKYLDGWEHWKMLCACAWFKPYVERWREELNLKLQAKALKRIKGIANSQTRDSLMANKWLLEKGFLMQDEKGKTRKPHPRTVAKKEREIEDHKFRITEDFQRIISPSTGKEVN